MILHIGDLPPATMMVGTSVLLVTAYLVIFRGDDTDKRLRERLETVQDTKSRGPGLPGAIYLEEEKPNLLLRFANILGYQSDLPARYSVNLKITLPIVAAICMIISQLLQTIISPPLAIAAGVAIAVGLLAFLFRRKSKAYRGALFNQIPDALSLMLRAVRAGLPVAEAIRSISRESMSPTREEFVRVAAETALGMPIETTLRRLFERTRIQDYAFFAVVIGLHAQTGGNLSETLENLADTVRRRVAMAGKAKALAAEGRLSAVIVGGLPFAVGVLITFTNPGYMTEFTQTSEGHMLILAFFVLLSTGLFATHMLVERSTKD